MGKWKKHRLFSRLAAIGLTASCVVGNLGSIPVYAENGTDAEDEIFVSVSERKLPGDAIGAAEGEGKQASAEAGAAEQGAKQMAGLSDPTYIGNRSVR